MIRRLITAASVISLVLWAVSLALWLLSYRQTMGMTAEWTTAIADKPYGELPV